MSANSILTMFALWVGCFQVAKANTPVVLKASERTYVLQMAKTTPAEITDNELQSSTYDVIADGTQWVLAVLEGGVGFAKTTPGTTIKAGKGYLVINGEEVATAKMFIPFRNVTNGISAIDADDSISAQPLYNLFGQRVGKSYKGIVISNGRKRIIR